MRRRIRGHPKSPQRFALVIGRQTYRDRARGQVFVAWDVGGKPIPDPLKNTSELLGLFSDVPRESVGDQDYSGDAGQYFALQMEKLIKGYQGKLTEADNIVVMGLDAATPGRMAITYYRELNGSEFLERVIAWHESHAWPQRYSKEIQFIGAPAPKEIAEAAYGGRLDDKSARGGAVTMERLLPCIVDGRPRPERSCRILCAASLQPHGAEKMGMGKMLSASRVGFSKAIRERSNIRCHLKKIETPEITCSAACWRLPKTSKKEPCIWLAKPRDQRR